MIRVLKKKNMLGKKSKKDSKIIANMLSEVKKISPAKINLYLEIINKRSDGYHNLESLMSFCDFGDVISVKKSNVFQLDIVGQFSKNLISKDNIIVETIEKLQDFFDREFKVYVKLTKNLPISSGMAGGSSNAATLIRAIIDLYKLKIEKERINELLISIGSDVPFCFFGKTALVQGKGEKVNFFSKGIPEFFVLLANPRQQISTKKIFERLEIKSVKRKMNSLDYSSDENFVQHIKNRKNDLEIPAIKQCKKISYLLDFFNSHTDCLFSRMTGSGATCFAVFQTNKKLINAEKILREKFKNYWIQKTKIVNEI